MREMAVFHRTPLFARLSATSFLRRTFSANSSPHQTRTILGVSLGLTASAVTFSVIAWPIADLCVAPRLIVCAIERNNTTCTKLSATEQTTISSKLNSAFGDGSEAGVCIVSGGNPEDRSAIARAYAARSGRPVVYLSLREATNPHDLFFSLVSELYLPLQTTQRLVCCMGVYWLILFGATAPCPILNDVDGGFGCTTRFPSNDRLGAGASHLTVPYADPLRQIL